MLPGRGYRTIGDHSTKAFDLPFFNLGLTGYIGISPECSEAKEDTSESLGDISEKVSGMGIGQ